MVGGTMMFYRIFIITLILTLSTVAVASADTDIGITFNQVVDQVGVGVTANTAHTLTDNIDIAFDTQAQYANTLIRGKYHAEVVLYDYLKLYQNGIYRGNLGSDIGSQNDLGFAINIPVLTGAGIGIGIFGRSGGEFAKPTLADIAEANGIDPDKIDATSQTLTAEPTGINYRPGESVNFLLYTDFRYKSIDVGLKFMPQLTGNNKAYQFVVNTNTSFNVKDNIKLNLGLDIGLQHYKQTIEYETAVLAAVSVSF